MRLLGDGITDGGKGPLGSELDREALGGVLLKKMGGWLAPGYGRQNDSLPLGRCHVGQELGIPSNVNACCVDTVNEGIGGCGRCDFRARCGKRRGGARDGVGGQSRRFGCKGA